MSSPLRIYYSQPAPLSADETDMPVTTSFAKTLRRFAEKEKPASSRSSLLSVVPEREISTTPEPKTKRPRVVGSPLTIGGRVADRESVTEAMSVQPAAAAEEPKKQSQAAAGGGLLLRAWSWLQKNNKFSAAKQLRVSETISLGEKRFVALVDIEGQKFLIGGGASGVSLLTQVGAHDSAREAMQAAAEAAGQSK